MKCDTCYYKREKMVESDTGLPVRMERRCAHFYHLRVPEAELPPYSFGYGECGEYTKPEDFDPEIAAEERRARFERNPYFPLYQKYRGMG